MSEFLDGIEGTDVGQDQLPFLGLGGYRLAVQSLSNPKKFGSSEQYARCVFKVVEAREGSENTIGSTVQVQIHKDQFGYFKKDILRLASAILSEPPATIKDTTLKNMFSDANPTAGVEINCSAFKNVKGKTRADGTPIVNFSWTAVPTAAVIAADAKPIATKAKTK